MEELDAWCYTMRIMSERLGGTPKDKRPRQLRSSIVVLLDNTPLIPFNDETQRKTDTVRRQIDDVISPYTEAFRMKATSHAQDRWDHERARKSLFHRPIVKADETVEWQIDGTHASMRMHIGQSIHYRRFQDRVERLDSYSYANQEYDPSGQREYTLGAQSGNVHIDEDGKWNASFKHSSALRYSHELPDDIVRDVIHPIEPFVPRPLTAVTMKFNPLTQLYEYDLSIGSRYLDGQGEPFFLINGISYNSDTNKWSNASAMKTVWREPHYIYTPSFSRFSFTNKHIVSLTENILENIPHGSVQVTNSLNR